LDVLGIPNQDNAARVLAAICPPDDDHIAGLWVGFALDSSCRPRLRLYANNGWGDATERWLRLIAALRQLEAGRFGAALQPLLPLLVPVFSPAGLAVTLGSQTPLCKLYLRPFAPPWTAVRAVATSVLGAASSKFITAIETGLEASLEALPERSLVLSTAGGAQGGPLDLKLDFCGHCLFEEDSKPERLIERLGRSLRLSTSPYEAIRHDLGQPGLRLPHAMLAFIGIGADTFDAHRINVYITPP